MRTRASGGKCKGLPRATSCGESVLLPERASNAMGGVVEQVSGVEFGSPASAVRLQVGSSSESSGGIPVSRGRRLHTTATLVLSASQVASGWASGPRDRNSCVRKTRNTHHRILIPRGPPMPAGMDIQGVQVLAARQGPRRKPQRSCTRTGTGSTRPTSRWWRRRRIKKLRAARKRGDQRRRSVKLPRALEGVQVRHALPGRRPSRSHRSRAAHKMVRATRTDGRRSSRTRRVDACVLSYRMGWDG